MINLIYYSKQNIAKPHFNGIKLADKASAEAIIKEIRGYSIKSNSMLLHRLWKLKTANINVPAKFYDKADKLSEEIYSLRPYKQTILENKILLHLRGNCGEMAEMAKQKLSKKFNEVDIMQCEITSEQRDRFFYDHFFPVINIGKNKPKFKMHLPNTWSKDAMVADPWTGIVDSAQQGIERIKDFLNIHDRTCLLTKKQLKNSPLINEYAKNPDNEKITWVSKDFIDSYCF